MAGVFAAPVGDVACGLRSDIAHKVELHYEGATSDLPSRGDVGNVAHQQEALLDADVVALVAELEEVGATSDWSL